MGDEADQIIEQAFAYELEYGNEEEDVVIENVLLKYETDKAYLIVREDGKKAWFPKSRSLFRSYLDDNVPCEGVFCYEGWIDPKWTDAEDIR